MSLSQVVENLRHDLRQGEAVSSRPDSDAGRVFIGYARVSTRGQDLEQQRAALGAAGCVRVFEEKASGAKRDRPELVRMLDHLRAGDVVTITRLDRLARSPEGRPSIAAKARGVRFGPSPALSAEQIAHARQLIHEDKKPVAEVARLFGVHRATLYRAIERNNVNTH